MTIKLTPAQQRLLQRAAEANGPIDVVSEALKTAQVLAREKLLTKVRGGRWAITPTGRDLFETPNPKGAVDAAKTPRANSKAAVVVGMLKRPEGATITQLSEATGWLPHSIRGFLAGALRRKYNLTPTSERADAGRVYRVQAAE